MYWVSLVPYSLYQKVLSPINLFQWGEKNRKREQRKRKQEERHYWFLCWKTQKHIMWKHGSEHKITYKCILDFSSRIQKEMWDCTQVALKQLHWYSSVSKCLFQHWVNQLKNLFQFKVLAKVSIYSYAIHNLQISHASSKKKL